MKKDKSGRSEKDSSNGDLTRSELPMSAQEILNQGEEASRLLNSPAYNLAHRSVIQNLQDEWIATKAHEREKREGLYQMIKGLSAVAAEMSMMVESANRLNESEMENERKVQLAWDENAGYPGHSRRA